MKYLLELMKDPAVATIASSSKGTVRRILAPIDFSKDLIVLEFGSGTGVVTRALLKHLSPKSKMFCFETNPAFCDDLRQIGDSRLHVVNASAFEFYKYTVGADVVISGIPLSYFSQVARHKLTRLVKRSLTDEGKFIVYQFDRRIGQILQSEFDTVRTSMSWWNLPPLTIFTASR